jgi:hypothetical protein
VSKSKERMRSMAIRSFDADFRSLIRRTHISISKLIILDILDNIKIAERQSQQIATETATSPTIGESVVLMKW